MLRRLPRLSRLPRLLFSAAVFLVAILMAGLIFVPASYWKHPINDAEYQGFDRNLLYADTQGDGTSNGVIDVSSNAIQITSLPASQPTVDLITTPLSFSAAFDARILQNASGGTPLNIGIWSPSNGSGYFIKFNGSPTNTVSIESTYGGGGSKTLVGGRPSATQVLGTYSLDQAYHVALSLDKKAGALTTTIFEHGSVPFAGRVLRAGDLLGDYEDTRANPTPVTPGKTYLFGGWVDYVAGSQPYAIGILWLDKRGVGLPLDNWWRASSDLSGWTQRGLRVVAPPQANRAILFLGSGSGSRYLFGDVYLRDASKPTVNLLSNGEFLQGAAGWRIINKPSRVPQIIGALHPLAASLSVTAEQFPQLFSAFRPTLSVSASSQNGTSIAQVENYRVILPSQPSSAAELVEKVDDPRARLAVLGLSGLGAALLGLALITVVFRLRRSANGKTSAIRQWGQHVFAMPVWLGLGVLAATLIFLVGNSLLFRLGSPHFDIYTPKIWSYLAATGGSLDLYHRPFLIPAAGAQGGIPFHDAAFPYGPTKVYYYTMIGEIYRWILSAPGTLIMDTFQLEFLLKFTNILFGLADALLIYLILKRVGVSARTARIATALFLFNPAAWFIMSIWGGTESVSIFFILLSIWFAESEHPTAAWLSLTLGAFTRPQMLVLAFLLGCVYLRKFSVGRNVMAVSWSVIAFFLLLTPLSLAISPSLPVDYVSHILNFSVGTGQADAAYTAISPGYYSVWTIPLSILNHQSGLQRMWFPRATPLYGSVSYAEAGTTLSVALVLLTGLFILLRGKSSKDGRYLPLVAFGMFGWLMVTTNLVARYFLYGLVLVILCRKSLKGAVYYTNVAILTVILFVTSWGHFVLDIIGNRAVTQALYPANSAITRLMMGLFTYDRFITAGSVANTLILLSLAAFAVIGLRRSAWPVPEPAPTPKLAKSQPVMVASGTGERGHS